jgi:hypothetical protein
MQAVRYHLSVYKISFEKLICEQERIAWHAIAPEARTSVQMPVAETPTTELHLFLLRIQRQYRRTEQPD